MKKLLLSVSVFFCVFLLFAAELTIIQTTDIHGNLSMENTLRPGIIRMASGIRALREQKGAANVLLIDCGDLTQGTASASRDHGKSMIAAVNSLNYDIWVPGNHDFDYGPESLLERMKEFKGLVLAANLEIQAPLTPPPNLRKWAMFQRAGKKIAVIGCIPPYLSLWIAQAQLEGIRDIDPADAIRAVLPEIFEARPDVVILAIHLGEFASGRLNPDGKVRSISTITSAFPRIRVVLGGHTHETVPMKKLYPGSVFMQAPPLGAGFGVVNIRFDDREKDISMTGTLQEAATLPEDPVLLKDLGPVLEETLRWEKTPVAQIPFELGPVDGPKTRCILAEILCDSMIRAADCDAAFSTTLSKFQTKPGRLREREVFLLAPYENYITVLTLTPAQVKEIIEEQYALKKKISFMHARGISFKVDSNGKVTGLTCKGKLFKTIRVAFGSYAVSGAGGRYPVLRRIGLEAPREDLPATVRTALHDFLKVHYPCKK